MEKKATKNGDQDAVDENVDSDKKYSENEIIRTTRKIEIKYESETSRRKLKLCFLWKKQKKFQFVNPNNKFAIRYRGYLC